MAEEEGAASAAKSGGSFLTRKVGPLPLIVWVGAAGFIYFYLKKKQTPATGPTAVTPGGTVGTTGGIGSSDQSGSGGGGSSGSAGTSGSTVGGQYATNDAWSRAAINYLVGIGVDPTVATSAITQFLASQTLTTDQQADVNLAIQNLGAPPSAPQPGNAPPPVVTPPGGVVYANNPPTGLTATGTTANSVTLTWNKVTNAQNYTVSYTANGNAQTITVGGTDTTAVVGGLSPDTNYAFKVQATPARAGDPSASVTASTSAAAASAPPPPPPSNGGGAAPPPPGQTGHWQPPQVATLVAGWSLIKYNQEHYGGSATTLATLERLNPGLNPSDSQHGGTRLIRTSDARWVAG